MPRSPRSTQADPSPGYDGWSDPFAYEARLDPPEVDDPVAVDWIGLATPQPLEAALAPYEPAYAFDLSCCEWGEDAPAFDEGWETETIFADDEFLDALLTGP